jgi:hypothetical protein
MVGVFYYFSRLPYIGAMPSQRTAHKGEFSFAQDYAVLCACSNIITFKMEDLRRNMSSYFLLQPLYVRDICWLFHQDKKSRALT